MRTGAPFEKARIAPATPTPRAEIGAARDHGLKGFARALGADRFDDKIVLFEDAGILAECRRLVFPVVDLADRDLQGVLRVCRQARRQERECSARDGSECPHRFLPFAFFRFP
jgi:hypothetical protein